MSDEILLSESNLERVWMDADWNVRVEHTDLGAHYFERRDMLVKRRTEIRGRWAAGLVGVAAGASAFAALSRVL